MLTDDAGFRHYARSIVEVGRFRAIALPPIQQLRARRTELYYIDESVEERRIRLFRNRIIKFSNDNPFLGWTRSIAKYNYEYHRYMDWKEVRPVLKLWLDTLINYGYLESDPNINWYHMVMSYLPWITKPYFALDKETAPITNALLDGVDIEEYL